MAHKGKLGEEWIWEAQHVLWTFKLELFSQLSGRGIGQATGHMREQKEHMGLRDVTKTRKTDMRARNVQMA